MAVTKEILALAVEIGDALLRNGAEVYRVEDTVMHILEAYEIENYDAFPRDLFPRMFADRRLEPSGKM